MEEDNKLYELLGVSRTSTDAEIKKVSFIVLYRFRLKPCGIMEESYMTALSSFIFSHIVN